MTIEEHINGLKGIKPYLQKKMLELNYEGLGELDALQVGETMDFAIESIKELETYKEELVVLRKAYEKTCDLIATTLVNREYYLEFNGKKVKYQTKNEYFERVKAEFLIGAKEELENDE